MMARLDYLELRIKRIEAKLQQPIANTNGLTAWTEKL
jgi:hypothetical protein